MKRTEKAQVIDSLAQDFSDNKAAFVVGYKGLTVSQMQTLRSELRGKKGTLKVAKGRLMKRSLPNAAAQDLKPYLKDQIALVFVKDEATPVAKVLFEFSKNNQALKLLAALTEGNVVNEQGIVEIASLPSRAELLARLCGVLNASLIKLMLTMQAIAEQKERA